MQDILFQLRFTISTLIAKVQYQKTVISDNTSKQNLGPLHQADGPKNELNLVIEKRRGWKQTKSPGNSAGNVGEFKDQKLFNQRNLLCRAARAFSCRFCGPNPGECYQKKEKIRCLLRASV